MRHLGLPPLAPVVASKVGRIREEEAQAVRQCQPAGRPRAMKLQAVMENLQRQQRARLQQELEARQQQELETRQPQQELQARQAPQQELQTWQQPQKEPQSRHLPAQELQAKQAPQQEPQARPAPQQEPQARQAPQQEPQARQAPQQEPQARQAPQQELQREQHAPRTSPSSANQNYSQPGHPGGLNLSLGSRGASDECEPEAVRIQRAQVAALAAMRAAAAGLSQQSSPGVSEESLDSEDDEQDRDSYAEDRLQDGGSEEDEDERKRKWDEDDFEEDMEEDYDDELDEGLVMDTGKPSKGPVLDLKQTPQLYRSDAPRPSGGLERLSSGLPPLGHSQLAPQAQDHGDWTYEEQFKQLYELDGDPQRKEFLDDLFSFMQKRGTPVNRIPIMAKQVLDLYMLYVLVTEKGGLVEVINKKLWREITKGLNLPTSITSAAFTLRTQYMKYLYPYECDKKALSNPNELQAAIDSNRREGRRSGFGGSLFTYSPSGAPNLLSPPKVQGLGLSGTTNGGPANMKFKKEDEASVPIAVPARVPVSLSGHQKVATAAQAAALENLREKMECGEPPEKKLGLSSEEQQRAMQRAIQHNLLAMSSQLPMSIRINSQGDNRQDSAISLTTNGTNSISMSVEINGIVYTGVLFAQTSGSSSTHQSSYTKVSSNRGPSAGGAQATPGLPVPQTPTSSNPSP
ncbi:AT-rich interactive domain-containing protein 3A [Lissotriton helveticus]